VSVERRAESRNFMGKFRQEVGVLPWVETFVENGAQFR
jgi:hypothetical protein